MTRARDLSRLSNSNAFSVDSLNRIGIGSTTPRADLDVIGNVLIGDDISIQSGIVTATTFSGNITGVAATFTGNVSIAGTLTYEDVTNIDSVGLITARSGVVLTGGDITLGTGVTASGATANTFTLSTGGSGRVTVDSSGNINVDSGGVYYDASNNRLAVGTTNPPANLTVANSGAEGFEFLPAVSSNVNRLQNYNRSGSAYCAYRVDASQHEFHISGSEKARLDSSGRLLVGTSSGSGDALLGIQGRVSDSARGGILQLRRGQAASALSTGDDIGAIRFSDNTSGNTGFAEILCASDGASGANDFPGRLVFSTTADGASSPTERMRITNSGNVLVAKTLVADPATVGCELGAAGYGIFTRASEAPLFVNRTTNDGTLVSLRQDNTEEGTISVSGNTVSYNQFLGSHWAALTDWSRSEIKIGTILETINELTDWKLAVIDVDGEQKKICYNGTATPGDTVSVEYEGETYEGTVELETNPEFNKAVKVKVNDTAASKAVYGVFVGWNNDSSLDGGTWNDMYVGAVGNYVIRMAAGQAPEIGDLVEADGTGCAVVQDDDIIRTKTVAKITSTIPQVTYDDGSFLVTCVLYCG